MIDNKDMELDKDTVINIPADLPPTPTKGEGAEQPPGYITANPITYSTIKEFRAIQKENPTEAEIVLWEYLRNKKLGYKIRRQHVIEDFIADFVCLSKRLIIEIDGRIHDFQKEYDAMRTFVLNEKGYKVIRFTNDEVLSNPQQVANEIKKHLHARPDSIKNEEPS
jgi:very-short-patch-repair endonuclease